MSKTDSTDTPNIPANQTDTQAKAIAQVTVMKLVKQTAFMLGIIGAAVFAAYYFDTPGYIWISLFSVLAL